MQNSQTTIYWIEIAKVLVPSLVALIVPFIASYWLSRKIELHKAELGKEIEEYKAELKYKYDLKSKQIESKVDVIKNVSETIDVIQSNLEKLLSNNFTKVKLKNICSLIDEKLDELRIHLSHANTALIEQYIITQTKEIHRKSTIFLSEYNNGNIRSNYNLYKNKYELRKKTKTNGETLMEEINNDIEVFKEQITTIFLPSNLTNQLEKKQ
jgi:hypothetical protein